MKTILTAPWRFLARRVRLLEVDSLVVASLMLGYVVAMIWEVVLGHFGLRFYLAIAALVITVVVFAVSPSFLRRSPGWMSTVLVGTFVAFLVESSITSTYGSGRGLFFASAVPILAIVLSLSLHDIIFRHAKTAEPEA